MLIIVLALLLMTISFIVDLPAKEINSNLFAQDKSPVELPIGSADSTLLNSMETVLQQNYGSQLEIVKDTASTTDLAFDKDVLFPLKLN